MRTLILLCAALTSSAMPAQTLNWSVGRKLRRTSKEDGNSTCSGIRQRAFALQTVLSSTKRGSLPSANTTLSFPMAVRCGHLCCASLRDPSNFSTHPCAISASKSAVMVPGFSSARVQFPEQCRRWISSGASQGRSSCFKGQCLLGSMEDKMPVGTPSRSMLCNAESGSPQAAAKAPMGSRRNGCPSATEMHAGFWQCGCRYECMIWTSWNW